MKGFGKHGKKKYFAFKEMKIGELGGIKLYFLKVCVCFVFDLI